MSDRLDELRRQRELQKEHLEWLDREIAELEGMLPESVESAPPVLSFPTQPGNGRAEEILEEYRQAPESIARKTRMGCLLYFCVALGLLAVAAGFMVMHIRASRGH